MHQIGRASSLNFSVGNRTPGQPLTRTADSTLSLQLIDPTQPERQRIRNCGQLFQ